jgi:hypothetical protein
VFTNFECGKRGHLCSYDVYAVPVNDMYMESSVNEGNTTPPRNSTVVMWSYSNAAAVICCDSYKAARNMTL